MGQIFPVRFVPYDLETGKERYLDCYRDAWTGAHGSLAVFDENAAWNAAVSRAAADPDCLLEARTEDGFAGVLAMDDRRGRGLGMGGIAFCYVVPELRGRGIGTQLIRRAEEHFRALGRKRLRLTVAQNNPAREFYRSLGFVRTGYEPGALEDLLVMERRI